MSSFAEKHARLLAVDAWRANLRYVIAPPKSLTIRRGWGKPCLSFADFLERTDGTTLAEVENAVARLRDCGGRHVGYVVPRELSDKIFARASVDGDGKARLRDGGFVKKEQALASLFEPHHGNRLPR